MLFAFGAPVKFARVGQRLHFVLFAGGETQRMAAQHLLSQFIEIHPLHTAGRADEAEVNHLILQADRLKDLRALVRVQRGDAHLGHHLEHALGHALAIGGHERSVIGKLVGIAQPFAARLPQRLERHVRIDRIRAVTDEQTVMMHFAGFAGFEHEADLRAQGVFHQIMMHRAGGHQCADRHAIGGHRAVAEDREAVAVLNRLRGFLANAIDRLAHAGDAFGFRESDVDLFRAPTAVIHALERVEFLVGQNRVRHPQPLRVPFRGLEQIFLRPNVTLERHDDLLANRIDRRIGHLREELAEVIVNHPRLVAETGERGVVAHRAKRIALFVHERQQHELQRLGGEAKRLHTLQQSGLVQPGGFTGSGDVIQLNALILDPFAVRALRGKLGLNLVIRHNAALLEIHEEQAARLQAALGAHVGRINRDGADLAGHDHAVIVRFIIAARTQTIAVEHGADVFAVSKRNRSRAVPRLHDATVILVKVALGLRHVLVLLPRLGDHQQHCLLQRAAAHQQKLQRVVEVARVGTLRLHDRIELLQIVGEQIALQRALPRTHGIHVTAQCVDLAVVAHEPERLRAIPAREGVRREARVHHRQVRGEIVTGEVGVILEHLLGVEHALVDHHLRREAADVKE